MYQQFARFLPYRRLNTRLFVDSDEYAAPAPPLADELAAVLEWLGRNTIGVRRQQQSLLSGMFVLSIIH